MILDKLIEKKDLCIYIDQRIPVLKDNIAGINLRLQSEDVSRKEKKSLMKGKIKVIGRIKELETLKHVLSNHGMLKDKAKEYWISNHT